MRRNGLLIYEGNVMEETRGDRIKLFSEMHVKARLDAGKSQEYMAFELGIAKKTVQNWEKGISSPSFFQSVEWFKVLGLNPFPYYMTYYYQKPNDSPTDKEVEDEYNELMKILPTSVKRALLFIFFGRHGSSPMSLIQLTLAHIHAPLKSRVINATIIKHNYDMAEAQDELICEDNILPDTELLGQAILCATSSTIDNKYGYVIKKEDAE